MKKNYVVMVLGYGKPDYSFCNLSGIGEPPYYTTEDKSKALSVAKRLAENHQYQYVVYESVVHVIPRLQVEEELPQIVV